MADNSRAAETNPQRPPVRGTPRSRLISSLVMLAMVVAGVVAYSIRKSNQLFDIGVTAHARCAIAGTGRRQAAKREMEQALGPQFAPMLGPLLAAAQAGEAISADRCAIEGRDYIYVIFRNGATPVSVILTQKRDQEVFPRAFAGHTDEVGGITLHETRRGEDSVAALETGGWLAYVVSALPERQNADVARKLTPVIDWYSKG